MNHPASRSLRLGRLCGLAGLLLRLGLGCFPAFLAAQPYAFRHFDDRDGLPQSQVYAILEDRDGFIWMGTGEGVARLGASGFRSFRAQEGLKPTFVNCLMQDRRGSIWVGGQEKGVAEIRGSRIRNFGIAEGLEIDNVFSLLERDSGEILAGARQGLFRKREDRFERVDLPDPWKYLPVYALAEDRNGRLWMGSRNGTLLRWDGKKVERAALPAALAEKPVRGLVRDPGGRLWALFPEMLLVQEPSGSWRPHPLPLGNSHPIFSSLSFSPQGEMILGLGGDGLLFQDRQGETRLWTYRDGLPREAIRAAIRDRRGVLWIGSDGNDAFAQTIPGLRVLEIDPETGTGLGLGSGLSFLELAPGRVLIGATRGLFLWEEGRGVTGRWQRAPGAGTFEVWALAKNPAGGVWVGTTKGLFRWTGGRLEPGPKALQNVVLSSILEHAGRLWVGTQGDGLAELTPQGKFIAFHSLPQEVGKGNVPKVLPRTWSSGPGLLLATQVGLYNFRTQGGRGQFWRAFAGTPVQKVDVTTIYEEPSGQLWVAVQEGLFGFVKGQTTTWTHLNALNAGIAGTPNWVVRMPRGELAVGHGRGISIVSERSVVQLTKNRGLLSDETNAEGVMLDSRQRLWIGMKGGLCLLEARQPIPEVVLPRPKVMEARWGGESRWLPERLDIPPSPGALELVFDTGFPASPVVPQYQVRIDGLDRNWRSIDINAGSTQIANIGPGEYRFRLRACLNEGQWVESEPLPIRVRPAWYQWTLTRVFLGLLGIGLLALLLYWRLRTLQRRAVLLEARVEERTETLALRNRSLERLHHQLKRSLESRVQLMRTVSHDLRSPLTSIMLSVDRLRDGEGIQPSEPMLNVLDREARRLEAIIRGLLDQAKSESLTESLNQRLCRPSEVLEGLMDTLRLKAEARDLAARLELDPAVDSVWILADTTSLQQVLFNLIENALKFTEPPGTVGVRSIVGEDTWALEVWDTGRGIEASRLGDIFQAFRQVEEGDAKKGWGLGLNICKTLVEAHSGRIEVASEAGKGSTFRVILPLVMPHQDLHSAPPV